MEMGNGQLLPHFHLEEFKRIGFGETSEQGVRSPINGKITS
jgi:hypothetical protein